MKEKDVESILSGLYPVLPVYSINFVVSIFQRLGVAYGLTPEGKLWFEPVDRIPAHLLEPLRASIKAQRRALEWLIRTRLPDYPEGTRPKHEAWLHQSDAWHWEFICYRAASALEVKP